MARVAVQVAGIAAILLVVGLVSIWAGQPVLVPSLASAAFLQLLTPEQQAARPWNIAAGQLIGLGAAIAMVHLLGAAGTPHFMDRDPLVFSRVAAAALAAGITAAVQLATRATSAAGGTVALLVALGAETPDWAGAGRTAAGVVLVTLFGEALRRAVLAVDK